MDAKSKMEFNRPFIKSTLIADLLGLILIAAGIIVMTGWLLKLSVLVQISAHSVPMQFNTALCFTLAGLAILLFKKPKHLYLVALSTIILFFSGLTLIEYRFGSDLGIDRLFIEPFIQMKTTSPGRMAPNTALSFLLFSFFLYLTLLPQKKLFFFTLFAPCVFGIIGLISVLGYLFQIEQAYAWGTLTHMAAHTALGFVFLAIASLIKVFSHHQLSEKQKSYLMDYVIFASTILFFLILWQAVKVNYIYNLKSEAANQVRVMNGKLAVEIQRDIEAVIRLFARHQTESYKTEKALNQDVKYYFHHMPALESFTFINAGQLVTKVNPRGVKGDTPLSIEMRNQICPFTINSNMTQQELFTSEKSGYLCVRNKDSAAVISLKKLFMQLLDRHSERFIMVISRNGTPFYQTQRVHQEHERFWGKTDSMQIVGNNWSITAIPTNQYVDESVGRIPSLVLSLGGFIACLVIFLLRYRRQLIAKEKELLSAEAIKTTILNSTFEGVLGVNQSSQIYFMNKSAEKLLDISFNQKKVITIDDLIKCSNSSASLLANIKSSLLAGQASKEDAGFLAKRNGDLLPVSYSTAPIYDENSINGAIVVFSDNSERKAYEEKLKLLALHDPLTNLPNRFSLTCHLNEMIESADLHQIPFSICFIDIDKFKSINDQYGHHIGDKALQHVAGVISSNIRKNDYFGRISGDEFCLILSNTDSEDDVNLVLEKIYQILARPFTFENVSIPISISVGVIFHLNERSPEELLIKADAAMYIKKKNLLV